LWLHCYCQNMYKTCGDSTTSFQVANFFKLTDVAANICRITHDWVMDLNDGYLAFQIMGLSHMFHYVDPLMASILYLWGHWNSYLNCESLMHYCMWSIRHWFGVQVLEPWVDECTWGHYPQCWLQPNCESTFTTHLSLIKQHCCTLNFFGVRGS
jgi:hypothetical protein